MADKPVFELLDKDFKKAVDSIIKKADSIWRVPFGLITQSWYKSNRAIFALKSKGKYTDLSDKYKKVKKRQVGFIYPILKAKGALSDSITKPGAPYSVAKIINNTTLVLGTTIPYGPAHQFGTKNIPKRPFILLGAEQTAPSEINRRRDVWIKLLKDVAIQLPKELGSK